LFKVGYADTPRPVDKEPCRQTVKTPTLELQLSTTDFVVVDILLNSCQ